MRDSEDRARYGPVRPESVGTVPVQRLPFDISNLSVTALVIMCELDDPPPVNSSPAMSMSITQYLRLSDQSMIRLDMDRGLSALKLGQYVEPVSWKQPATEVIDEVLNLVQADSPEPNSFPWEQYADAALLREISVTADELRNLPHTMLPSDELAAIYEF